jgi:hypothetical protein
MAPTGPIGMDKSVEDLFKVPSTPEQPSGPKVVTISEPFRINLVTRANQKGAGDTTSPTKVVGQPLAQLKDAINTGKVGVFTFKEPGHSMAGFVTTQLILPEIDKPETSKSFYIRKDGYNGHDYYGPFNV